MSHAKRFQDFITESNWGDEDHYEYDPDAELLATVEDILDHMSYEEYARAAFKIAPDEIFHILKEKIIEAAERRNFTHRGDILDMIRGKMPGL